MLCIWWDQFGVVYYELFKPSETIKGNRYKTQLMCLSQHWKTNSCNTTRGMIKWFCSMTLLDPTLQTGQDVTGEVEKGSATPPTILFRRCSLGLSPVSIHGTWHGWSALSIVWRSRALDRFVDRLKWWPILWIQDSYTAWMMGESSA